METTGVKSVEWDYLTPQCVEIVANLESRTVGYGLLLGLSSDRHHDNAHTDQALEKRHLDRGRSMGAVWIDAGDMHCAMQGKWDRRRDTSALRPEYVDPEKPYFDCLVDEAADFYKGYEFAIIMPGNHESAIKKHHETDLTKRTVGKMREKGSRVLAGKYQMWVIVKLRAPEGQCQTHTMLFHHGYGGGGPVTKGVIQTARMMNIYPDANAIVTGHTHDSWIVPRPRERISSKTGRVWVDDQVHIRCGTYKNEREGWHEERGAGPNNIGGVWHRISWKTDKGGTNVRPAVHTVAMGRD